MKSYFATLLVIFNSNNFYNPNTYSEYLKYLDYLKGLKKSWKIRFLIDNWPRRIKNIIQFPKSYIYYEKRISRRELIHQKTIWIENSLIFSYKNKKFDIVKFLVSILISLYLLLFPFLLFIHYGLFFIGLIIFLNMYLIKIRIFFF